VLNHQVTAESVSRPSSTIARREAVSSLVLHELQHRMANTLTVLHASLRREFAAITDPDLKEAVRRHEAQIMSVAALHRFFANSAGKGEISAEAYFQALSAVLSRSVLAPLGLHCETFVDKGRLSAEKCEWLGLAITELVMNAAKHAFPDGNCGRVRIEVLARDECWCCTVSDNGVGMQNAFRGTGSRITDCLIEALDGQLAIRAGTDGTATSIVFVD
jgi:two-component sensor histidine kinase